MVTEQQQQHGFYRLSEEYVGSSLQPHTPFGNSPAPHICSHCLIYKKKIGAPLLTSVKNPEDVTLAGDKNPKGSTSRLDEQCGCKK